MVDVAVQSVDQDGAADTQHIPQGGSVTPRSAKASDISSMAGPAIAQKGQVKDPNSTMQKPCRK